MAFNRFLLALIFILILIAAGTTGYLIIEDWSLIDSIYMTFVSLTTVGYGEVHPLSEGGKIFTIVFLTVSLITIGYTLSTVITFIFEGHVKHTLKERKMKKILGLIKEHYIICGYGDVGREAAQELSRKHIPFVIVDNSLTPSDLDRNPDFMVIQEDATEELVLEKARIHKAKGVISCLANDQLNVYTVLTARQMNPHLHIVAKASDNRAESKLLTAGADRVILPKQIAGRRMATIATHPAIIDFLDILSTGGDEEIRIEAVTLKSGSRLINNTLRESQIGQDTGAIIIGILDNHGRGKKNTSTTDALSAIVLEEGDQLVALGNEMQLKKLNQVIKK